MLEKKGIYVGIYSSSHETIARAEDKDGNFLGKAILKNSININISIKHSWEIIKNIIFLSLKKTDLQIDDPNIEIHVGLGIKNTELIEACLELKKQNTLFKNFIIAADGYVLLRGAHQNDGAIIILDDGIVGNAIKSNKLFKIGGWGFPHADKGSIPWIGLEAIRLTIQWLDGFIDNSSLLMEIYRYFDNDISKLVKWAMCSRTDPNEYNIICNMVLDHLYKEDKYSLFLINSTALEATKVYEKLLEKTNSSSILCSLHGNLVPHIKNFITDSLAKNMVDPLGDGAHGALTLIRDGNFQKCVNPQLPHNYSPSSKYIFTG